MNQSTVHSITFTPMERENRGMDVPYFVGTLALPQKQKAQIAAVDTKELIAGWNGICPFYAEGERWVFFNSSACRSPGMPFIPYATVLRLTPEKYEIQTLESTFIEPYTLNHALRISNVPCPIRDGRRGWWKIFFENESYNRCSYLYAEYFGSKMKWVYYHCTTHEVGPMGHYEDDPFSCEETHEESEFATRDDLMRKLADFVPRSTLRTGITHPVAGWHALSGYRFTDDVIQEHLASFFR